jgi:hypothetical protein
MLIAYLKGGGAAPVSAASVGGVGVAPAAASPVVEEKKVSFPFFIPW